MTPRPHPRPVRARARRSLLAAGLVGALLAAPASIPVATAATPARAEQGLDAWWYDVMHIDKAHEQTTGEGVKIAVIDEAIDPDAPELRGARVTLGRDCKGARVKRAQGTKADHGTNVTTLISGTGRGTGPGGRGILGMAPGADVTFYATDTDPGDELVDCDTSVYTADLVTLAMKDHPDIISTSLGLGYTPPMRKALARALAEGIVVVGATGDRTRPSISGFPMEFPAARPGVVAVNAVDKKALPWANNPPPVHSFVDAYPTISAPGVAVTGMGYQQGRGWVSGVERTGTSDAAPIVAGAMALVKSKYPDATGNQLIQHLIHYSSSDTYKWTRFYGYGIVSVTRMLQHDPTRWPDVNPLLKSPKAAMKAYPMSAYGATQPSSSADPTDGSSGDASRDASEAPATSGDDTRPSASGTSDSGGVPVWVWPLAAVVVVGVAGSVIAVNKRGSRPVTTAREEG